MTTASDLLTVQENASVEHWKWRMEMSRIIAGQLDFNRFGVKGIYICGSTKEATAGPASDIDLIVHMDEDVHKQEILVAWMEGWGLSLSHINFLKTGYYIKHSLIDLHIITDKDIINKTSFASMIGSCFNAARPIKVREK